jgi:acetyltransferase-like isoleucine patch superfamily enzyme
MAGDEWMSIGFSVAAIQRVRGPIEVARLKRAGVVVGQGVTVVGSPLISLIERDSIEIGDNTTLVSQSRWTALGVGHRVVLRTLLQGATISIGADVGMSGTTVCAAHAITIGDRVLLGADVMIIDTDFHPLDQLPRRHCPIPTPDDGDEVVVGEDAFIGARSIVLKGSTVGEGAVIGAGSVVSGRVPPLAVFAGVPATFVRWVGSPENRGRADR